MLISERHRDAMTDVLIRNVNRATLHRLKRMAEQNGHSLQSELHRILESSDLWDKKVWGLQVTNASERAVEMRALMSAPDAPTAWNLRCEVREKLLAFVQQEYPGCLPRVRAEFAGEEAKS